MAEDNDLEKRAIEELLRETDRARVRAETMGPAGWLKCPLKSTNKRFLLNTLRYTGLQRRSSDSRSAESATRGRLRSESPERRRRDRSRSPHRDHGRNRGHRDKHYHEDSSSRKHKRREKEEDIHDRCTRERKHERSNEGHTKERHK